jgi:ATP-dependent DNA helicase RecG
LPEPVIKESTGGIQLTIYNHNVKNYTTNDTISDTINDRQRLILTTITRSQQITMTELAEQTKVGLAAVKRDIDALKEKDIIKRIGSRKTGYWQINAKTK